MRTGRRPIRLIVALLVVGLGVGWPIATHYLAKARLARYKAWLKAAGERLTVPELAPPASAEGFSASMDLLQAAGLLRSLFSSSTSPNWSNFPPVMKYVGPGKALASWQQPILPTPETPNVWPGLRQEIEANADALAAVRAVLRNAPTLAFNLDYNQGAGLLLGHLSALSMERASVAKAYAQARASAGAAQVMLTGASARSSLSELAELGKEVLQHPQAGLRSFMRQYPAYWVWRWWQSYDDELVDAETSQVAIDAMRQVRREKILGPALKQFDGASTRIRQGHPKAGTYFGYSSNVNLQRFLLRVTLLEIQRSLTVAAIALKRYALRHGAYPTDLGALVPEFLAAVPRDVMDGQPLRYRLNVDGSFLLYSVGEDGVDNGGDSSPIPSASKGWTRARDVVWPAPANAQEVKEMLQTMGKK